MTAHDLVYRAGSRGMAAHGIPDAEPHWYCSCGAWTVYRDHNGNPFETAARKQHRAHIATISESETE